MYQRPGGLVLWPIETLVLLQDPAVLSGHTQTYRHTEAKAGRFCAAGVSGAFFFLMPRLAVSLGRRKERPTRL